MQVTFPQFLALTPRILQAGIKNNCPANSCVKKTIIFAENPFTLGLLSHPSPLKITQLNVSSF